MKKIIALTLLAVLACAPVARADKDKDSNKNKDCKFLESSAEASLLWNLIGTLAQTNTTNFALPPGGISHTNATNVLVLGLGSQLATNHALLFSNAVTLQVTNGCDGTTRIDSDDLDDLRKLAGRQGARFDREFLEFVIEETIEAIEDAQEAALKSKSAAVRAYARQQLIVLNAQLVAALEAGESVLGGDFDDIDDD